MTRDEKKALFSKNDEALVCDGLAKK